MLFKDNARIIHLKDLPYVGKAYIIIGSDDLLLSMRTCISVMLKGKQDGYLIYEVRYVDGEYIDIDVDIETYSYAVLESEFKETTK